MYLWCDSQQGKIPPQLLASRIALGKQGLIFQSKLEEDFHVYSFATLLFPRSHHGTNEGFVFKGLIPAVCLCTVNHTVSS